MENNNYFISNLIYLTHKKDTTCNVKQLSSLLGISRQSLRSYMIGESEPKIHNLIKVCDAYDITPTQLLKVDLKKINF